MMKRKPLSRHFVAKRRSDKKKLIRAKIFRCHSKYLIRKKRKNHHRVKKRNENVHSPVK